MRSYLKEITARGRRSLAREAQVAPSIGPAAKSHRWYAATVETTCQCGLKEFEESPVAKKTRRPGAVFFVVRTPNSHLKLYLHSIVVAKRLEERIWTNRVASKIVFPPEISVTRAPVHDGTIVSPASVLQLVHPGTGALLHVERVIYSSRSPFWLKAIFGSDTTLSQLRQRVRELCLWFVFALLCLLWSFSFSILIFCPLRLDSGLEPLNREAIASSGPGIQRNTGGISRRGQYLQRCDR